MTQQRVSQTLTSHPDDWWSQSGICRLFADKMSKSLVGLHVLYEKDGKNYDIVYSGVLVLHDKYCVWITAGHLIDELSMIREDADVHHLRGAWLDKATDTPFSCVPTPMHELTGGKVNNPGVDFGFIVIPAAVARPLLNSIAVEPMTESRWRGCDSEFTEGYMMMGFPRSLVHTNWAETNGGLSSTTTFTPVALPIELVEDLGEDANSYDQSFWGHKTAFYGRVLEPSPTPANIQDIKGMSGGPIFSVRREGNGVRCHLFALQSSWLPDSRIAKATRIDTIDGLLRHGLAEIFGPPATAE